MAECKIEITALWSGFIVWRRAPKSGWRRYAVEEPERVARMVLEWLRVDPEDLVDKERE